MTLVRFMLTQSEAKEEWRNEGKPDWRTKDWNQCHEKHAIATTV